MQINDKDFEYAYGPPPTTPAIGVTDIFWILRRAWLYPVIGCLIGLAAAACYIALAPSVYKSTARILLDRSVNRYLQSNKIISEPTYDDTDVRSQIHVLSRSEEHTSELQSLR